MTSNIKKDDKFGRLTVVNADLKVSYFIVKCVCGNTKSVRRDHLLTGKTLSCGCLFREMLSERNTTHGMSRTSEYRTWKNILHRCNDETDHRFKDYGGRGIRVCPQWLDFAKFLEDMGKKPFDAAQIDRSNNFIGYNKENCSWVTRKQNQRNTRSNRLIEYKGEVQPLVVFAERFGINKSTLHKRISRSDWSVKMAIETPVLKRKKPRTLAVSPYWDRERVNKRKAVKAKEDV